MTILRTLGTMALLFAAIGNLSGCMQTASSAEMDQLRKDLADARAAAASAAASAAEAAKAAKAVQGPTQDSPAQAH